MPFWARIIERRTSGWLLLALPACTPPPPLAASSESARRPPGIVADPPFTPPPPRKSAEADGALVTLETPRGQSDIRALVARFFHAVVTESNAELSRLMTGNAIAVFPNTTGTSAIGSWNRRFAALDYLQLRADNLYVSNDIATYDARDVVRLRGVRDFHLDPTEDELLAVVPLRATAPRLLGSQMQFLLTLGPDGYRIRATYEDFVAQ